MADSLARWTSRRPGVAALTPVRYPWAARRTLTDDEEVDAVYPGRAVPAAPIVGPRQDGSQSVKSLLYAADGRTLEVEDPRGLEWKTAPAGLSATLDDEGDGIITVLGSVTGLVDRVQDNIHAGAYTKTLVARRPKVIRHHDWKEPVGKVLEIAELRPGARELPDTLPDGTPWPSTAGALASRVQFNLKTGRGADAYADALFYGPDQEWSIGYSVPAGGATRSPDGVRQIKTLDLYEISQVLWGAMPLARTMAWTESPG